MVGSSLLLFALRGPSMQNQNGTVEVASFGGLSREMMLLLNNILLVSAMAMILIGTLYPLIADVLEIGKISVGPPYFDFFFVPLTLGLMAAMGLAVFSRWKKTDARTASTKRCCALADQFGWRTDTAAVSRRKPYLGLTTQSWL